MQAKFLEKVQKASTESAFNFGGKNASKLIRWEPINKIVPSDAAAIPSTEPWKSIKLKWFLDQSSGSQKSA